MNRRSFLVGTSALGAAHYVAPLLAAQQKPINDYTQPLKRTFEFTHEYNLKAPYGASGETRLWVPLIENTAPFQTLTNLRWSGNYEDAYIATEPIFGAQSLYVKWPSSSDILHLKVTMKIQTQSWEPAKRGDLSNYTAPTVINYPKELDLYLRSSRHIPTDGIVKQIATDIVGNEHNPLIKAQLIHNWVAANMERDNSVIGCGIGDVGEILTTGKLYGKCTDINSVFVALARAAGIPAREMFGIRLGRPGEYLEKRSRTAFGSASKNGHASITDWQHCRAQFYLAGYGWVPCDPADVTKLRLTENLSNDDKIFKEVNEYMFGNWDMNWVGFNYARDFSLSPKPEQYPMNNYGYPYAEVGGDPIDYYDFKNFSYEYSSVEEA